MGTEGQEPALLAAGIRYQALIRDREAAKATVIVFHGNAGSALHRDYYANALGRQGYRGLLPSIPAMGASWKAR